MNPIYKNGIRIFRPSEYDALIDAVAKKNGKYKYIEILNALLYTGMRYVELERFQKHPEWFDKKTRVIYLPPEASKKKERKMKDRYVHLSFQGVTYIETFIRYVDKLPDRYTLNDALRYWGEKAGLGRKGVTVKAFRKTWESWLVVSYPDRIDLITMSQGHTELVSMRHYLNIPFTREDKEEIKMRTAGWIGE